MYSNTQDLLKHLGTAWAQKRPMLAEGLNKPLDPPYLQLPEAGKVLAKYSIPLGQNKAHIEITGDTLHAEDFDALKEYVDLFKKQFQRTAPADTPKSNA